MAYNSSRTAFSARSWSNDAGAKAAGVDVTAVMDAPFRVSSPTASRVRRRCRRRHRADAAPGHHRAARAHRAGDTADREDRAADTAAGNHPDSAVPTPAVEAAAGTGRG